MNGFIKRSFNFLRIISSKRFQRAFFIDHSPDWTIIKAGIPQGSILGLPFLFTYINGYFDGVTSTLEFLPMAH